MKTSTNTVAGVRCPNTAPFGFHTPPSLVGRLIATATGCGFRPGAGLGWMMLPGALRHSITAAGLRSAEFGAGCLVRHAQLWVWPMYARFTLLRLSPGSAGRTLAWASGLAEAVESAWLGSRWRRVKSTYLLIASAARTLQTSTSPIRR